MRSTSTIYEPTGAGELFIAAIFDPDGQIIASHGFPTRGQASAFVQAFMQEGAGEYALSPADEEEEPLVRPETKRPVG